MKQKKRPVTTDMEAIMPMLIGIWRRFHKLSGPKDCLQTREFRSVISAIQTLKEGLAENGKLIGQDYFSDPHLLGAYLLYQWAIHYQEGLSLISELPTLPKRVLEVGAGPAPFSFAALRLGAREVFACDKNLGALTLGAEACGHYGYPISLRKWNCRREPLSIAGEFDLIILGHCLEELFPSQELNWQAKQQTFIQSLLERLTPNGFLLLVESSQLGSNQRILALRDALVSQNVPVQAPCVWQGKCPVLQLKNSPCYAQRELERPLFLKEVHRAAKINQGSLKMTYVIFKSPASVWPTLPERKFYRVISPAVETYQGSKHYLCGLDGKKALSSHLKEQSQESRAYDYLRRGQLISISNALESNTAIDIISGTTLSLEADCGKPIPETHSNLKE